MGASSIAFGLQIAIEAAMVAGSTSNRRIDMANIGTFKKSGQEFQGDRYPQPQDQGRSHRPRGQSGERQRP